MESVCTKSRAKNDSDCPFWWNENQKKTAMPSTAKSAYIRCLISLAMALFSSSVYPSDETASFFPGVGKRCFDNKKMANEINMVTTEAMNE